MTLKNKFQLSKDLYDIRRYYAKTKYITFKILTGFQRNKIRHRARKEWEGGYVLQNNLLFYVPHRPLDLMASNKLWKPYFPNWAINKFLPKDGVAIDVGANIGDWTLPMAERVGRTGRILSYEPVPHMHHALQKSILANGFSNVYLSMDACSNFIGEEEFSVELGNSGGSRIGYNPLKSETIQVNVVTLDNQVEKVGINRLDLLKIDVEGEEANVLQGAKHCINSLRPAIIIEIRKDCAEGPKNIVDFFSSVNYNLIGCPTPYGVEECSINNLENWNGMLSSVDIVDFIFLPFEG